jgi:hypothetical protein
LRATEFDIDVGDDQALQAQLMHDYLTVMFSHPAMEAVTMWGFWEEAHWRDDAALYESDWTEKPALVAYQDLVFGEWWTDQSGVSDAEGDFSLRGFDGEYDVVVTLDGQQYLTSEVLLDDDLELLVTLSDVAIDSADFSADGDVDGDDLLIWQRGFGTDGATDAEGDADGDGMVDQTDLGVWQNQFGAMALIEGSQSVPEPRADLLVVLFGAICSAQCLRRPRCTARFLRRSMA